MKKRFICDIDQTANEGRPIPMHVALKRVVNYIHVHYDDTFPHREFVKWADSDTEKPFRHNKVLYYWCREDVPKKARKNLQFAR